MGIPLSWVSDTDTCTRKDYFLIYDAIGDSFPLVAQTEWSPYDTMRTLHIMFHMKQVSTVYDTTCCGSNQREDIFFPLKEYYFDNPVYVDDSFYVGGTYFGGIENSNAPNTHYPGSVFSGRAFSCDGEFQQDFPHPVYPGVTNGCVPVGMPMLKYKGFESMLTATFQHVQFSSSPWRWELPYHGLIYLIYPIIEVDTTVPPAWACDTIQNVQATVSGTSATVTWDGFPNYSSTVLRYGLRNEPQSQWREVDVTGSTLHTLTGLSPSFIYGVSLKAECNTSKKETPWSAPLYFYVPTDTTGGGTQGVEGTTALSRLTFLQPNPAREEVMVTSSFNLSAIDIWTADGVMVYHGERSGHDAVIDVSWLPAGTYIVAIHTHDGTTHKRLLIAR